MPHCTHVWGSRAAHFTHVGHVLRYRRGATCSPAGWPCNVCLLPESWQQLCQPATAPQQQGGQHSNRTHELGAHKCDRHHRIVPSSISLAEVAWHGMAWHSTPGDRGSSSESPSLGSRVCVCGLSVPTAAAEHSLSVGELSQGHATCNGKPCCGCYAHLATECLKGRGQATDERVARDIVQGLRDYEG